jgi:hypothetical protein
MSEYITFEGRIEPMPWGRATYTVLPLPDWVESALSGAKRVEGEIADYPINLAPTRAPVREGAFLWAGKTLLDRIGIAAGDVIEVRLRPAPDDLVVLDDDIAAALRAAGQTARWDGLTAGKKRGLLHKIDTAKTAATRLKRIQSLINELSE